MRALLVYPTHQNCAEVQAEATALGLDAAVYPGRFTVAGRPTEVGEADAESGNPRAPNCWNIEADDAEAIGFPVVKTICPTCSQRRRCRDEGYLGQLEIVQQSDVALCTQKRIEYSGFSDLSSGRPYVSVHENPIDLLRPQCGCSVADLFLIQALSHRLLDDPRSLNWFGTATQIDDEGHEYESEEVACRRDRLYEFCHRIADVADDLLGAIECAERITEWPIPTPLARPTGIERLLFTAVRALGLTFSGQPWRFVLSAAAGELQSAAIMVRQPRSTASDAAVVKFVTGYRENPPAAGCTTWFNDATVAPETLRAVLQRAVVDLTPRGRLELQKRAVQIPRDITRKSSLRIFFNVVRGILAERPQFTRIGLITHSSILSAITQANGERTLPFVRTTHFGSGEDRSSNAWHAECDLIVIAGTPRVPPQAIVEYLMQIGRVGAAAREPVWGPLRWTGRSESGEPVLITGRGYYDEDWRLAHRALVRAALVQAIGRGRGILDQGCEVVVLTTEECGIPISDSAVMPLPAKAHELADLLRELSAVNSKKGSLEKTAVSTSRLAREAGLSTRQTRDLLGRLELLGLVLRVGERKGWLPVDHSRAVNDADPEEVPRCQPPPVFV